MKIVKFVIGASLFLAGPACADTMTNDTVISLLKAGLGDDVVIAKIKTSQDKFNTSTDQIIALKQQGISGPVIAAMISAADAPVVVAMSQTSPDPSVPHPSGIYYLDSAANPQTMQRIYATTTSESKSSGMLGYALTSGLIAAKVKAEINGEAAAVHAVERLPVFYFYFDQAAQGLSAAGGTVTSPNEFSLMPLEVKNGHREVRVGRIAFLSVKSGLNQHDRVSTSVVEVFPGVYKVSPSAPLTSGQYGFVSGTGGGSSASFRVYDFSVS